MNSKLDFSAMLAHHDSVVEKPRYVPLAAGTFPASSLQAWLNLAKKAAVPYVEAKAVGQFCVDHLLRYDQHLPESEAALATLDKVNQALPEGFMLRWDCCAPLGIKLALSKGRAQCPDREDLLLHPGDPRAFDILFDFPDSDIVVFQRPWVSAMTHEGYPVEFRVMIRNARVVAVSNYYPQVTLPASKVILGWAKEAAVLAQKMLDQMRKQKLVPAMNGYDKTIEATLDFLVTQTGEVLFLEGGPGFGWGAHPCCFYDGHSTVVKPEGIVLATGGESYPLKNEDRTGASDD